MDRKIFTILFSAILLVGFFLPYIGGIFSGYDILSLAIKVKGEWSQYLLVLVPLSAVILIIGALNNERYFLGRELWVWLPFLVLAYVVIRLIIETKAEVVDVFKGMSYGYWISLGASIFLAFGRPRLR